MPPLSVKGQKEECYVTPVSPGILEGDIAKAGAAAPSWKGKGKSYALIIPR